MTVTQLEILQATATSIQGQIDNISNQANLQKLRLQQTLDNTNVQIDALQNPPTPTPPPAQ